MDMYGYIFFAALILVSSAYVPDGIVSARIETCRGCSLNRLPEVKTFVMEDAPLYDKLDVKFISGAPPELILLGEGDRELERLPLSQLDRKDCNDLLLERGFARRYAKSDL